MCADEGLYKTLCVQRGRVTGSASDNQGELCGGGHTCLQPFIVTVSLPGGERSEVAEEKEILRVGNSTCRIWGWEKMWHLGTAENFSAAG